MKEDDGLKEEKIGKKEDKEVKEKDEEEVDKEEGGVLTHPMLRLLLSKA